MSKMTDPSVTDPTLWQKLFEQTPEALRWVFTVLSLGGFALARHLWKRSQDNVERIERQVHERIDRKDAKDSQRFEAVEHNMHARLDGVESRFSQSLDEMNAHLIEIAQNTRKH